MNLPNDPRTPRFLRTIKMIVRPLEYLDTYAQRYGDTFRVGEDGMIRQQTVKYYLPISFTEKGRGSRE